MATAPKGGKQPTQKTAIKPARKINKIVKGAPTKGSGSDTNPFSSAHSSMKGGKR
jgi:hypothetical protein